MLYMCVCLPACINTRDKIRYTCASEIAQKKKKKMSSLQQRVCVVPGEQALNKMLELQPEFKMKCFKMHSKQQLQARAGPDSLLMLA